MARPQARAPRKTAFIKAHLQDGGEWQDVTIGNISTSGLMAKSQANPPVGAKVEIRRRGMVVTGEVVWSLPTRFGLRSFRSIDVDALTADAGLATHRTRTEAPILSKLWHWRHST